MDTKKPEISRNTGTKTTKNAKKVEKSATFRLAHLNIPGPSGV